MVKPRWDQKERERKIYNTKLGVLIARIWINEWTIITTQLDIVNEGFRYIYIYFFLVFFLGLAEHLYLTRDILLCNFTVLITAGKFHLDILRREILAIVYLYSYLFWNEGKTGVLLRDNSLWNWQILEEYICVWIYLVYSTVAFCSSVDFCLVVSHI